MKKTFLSGLVCCSIFLFTIPLSAMAQKHSDLALSIVSPTEGQEIPYGDTLNYFVSIKNLGPDPVDSTENIFMNIEGSPLNTQFNLNLPVGDSIVYLSLIENSLQDTDYIFNICLFLQSDLYTGIEDSIQSNDTACVTVIFKGGGTGIGDINNRPAILKLYPNPATSEVMLPLNMDKPEPVSVFVKDITGGYLFHKNYGKEIHFTGHHFLKLDISSFQPGIYFVELEQGLKRRIGKLVVQ